MEHSHQQLWKSMVYDYAITTSQGTNSLFMIMILTGTFTESIAVNVTFNPVSVSKVSQCVTVSVTYIHRACKTPPTVRVIYNTLCFACYPRQRIQSRCVFLLFLRFMVR